VSAHEGNPGGQRQLLAADDVSRTIARIAHQVIEKMSLDGGNAEQIVLLGIPRRGVVLARRLADCIAEFSGATIARGALDVTLYRDDLRRHPNRPLEATTIPPGGVDEKDVLLVDDVLFSGRTVRAALDALREEGRPRTVSLAVLIDRGHRELPVRADYVGKNVPTSRAEDVAVLLSEVDGRDTVLLHQSGASQEDVG
jgi:pyrimidine operon attenuation protein/uracil phosphoribosyltransferase